jgi:hypothetical protein
MKRLASAIVAVSAVWPAWAGVVPAGAIPAAGFWGRAIDVPGWAALGTGVFSEVSSVSCGSCGYATGGSGGQHGFAAAEQDGRRAKAIRVPGLGS